jgi:inner membrane protein YidH
MKELPLSDRAALVRTRLALERTLMAWLRTAISLITFGFTLYKAVQYAHEIEPQRIGRMLGTRRFALLMMSMGLVALIAATAQHIRRARSLREIDTELPVFSTGTMISLLFSAAGVYALLSVVLRD